MGSLYDIGNFRYKHFTFYSTCGTNDTEECQEFNNINSEIVGFLNAVWPLHGLLIGDSSEGDYAFVTYVQQENDTSLDVVKNITNIHIYTRMSLGGGREPEWVKAVDPVKTLDATALSMIQSTTTDNS
jgi:hypothetical protein